MYCRKCGEAIREGSRYCVNCGQETMCEADGRKSDICEPNGRSGQNPSVNASPSGRGDACDESGKLPERDDSGVIKPFDISQSDEKKLPSKTVIAAILLGAVLIVAIVFLLIMGSAKSATKYYDTATGTWMSGGEAEDTDQDDDSAEGAGDNDDAVEGARSDGEWYTADEVSEQYQYNFFAKKEDAFYPVDGTSYNADGNVEADGKPRLTGEKRDGVLYTGSDDPADFRLTVHVSSGEKLTTNFNADEFKFEPVVDMGYYQVLPLNFDEIEGVETDGRDLEVAANTLSKEGFKVYQWSVIGSVSKDDSITIGNYYGSDFEEEESHFETPYCIALNEKTYIAPVKKTKLGYFEVDLKNVPLGTYMVQCGVDSSVLVLD